MKLADLKKGDTVVRTSWTLANLRVVDELKVLSVSKKSLTTENGVRWNLNTRRVVGDPGYGNATTIEPYDANVHPYAVEAERARKLVFLLQDVIRRTPTKNQAAAVGLLESALAMLEEIK